MIHKLKTHPAAFRMVDAGLKRFEFRKNDRNFQVDDLLILQEFDGDYTGHKLVVSVTYILRGPDFGVPPGFCVMSIV